MDIDNILAENTALKRKLESKTEALLILSQELNRYKLEEENFKCHKERKPNGITPCTQLFQLNTFKVSGCNECRQLSEYKEKNKGLLIIVEELRQKINDAEGDIQTLRKEKKSLDGRDGGNWHGRESLVASLESAISRSKQLEADLATVLDEKQELVSERDAYRCKVHRLNHQIATLLKAPQLDIDSLIMENKYLQERLDQSLAEKEILQQSLTKYKGMLEKRRNKGTVQLGTTASCEGMVVTHRQVQELLEGGRLSSNEATLADLRALCLALLESLQDKSLALAHHKKTNKVLAGRIAEFESLLSKDSEKPLFPSRLLMGGYSSSNVDKEVDKLTKEEICDSVTIPSCDEDFGRKISLSEENNELLAKDSDSEILPPELQDLVLKAIQDIKKDSNAIQ